MQALNPLLEVDLAALCGNYRALSAASPGAEAAAVVKCDAYGLGAYAVARALQAKEKCRSFFVAYSEEGEALRAALGREAEIFVFNGPFPEFLAAYRNCRLTPVLNSLDQAKLWASEMGGAPAALQIDTGMHRLGVAATDLAALRAIDGLKISLVMSHLACASDPNAAMNARQRDDFLREAAAFPGARRSLSSTGGALIGEKFGFDMTRLGVGLYGVNPFDAGASPSKPVARLTAPVIAVHGVPKGDSVGYGATFKATRDMALATVSIGYGDGFPRAGSNRAKALLAGGLAPIVGRVSMDLVVIDATDLKPRPSVGDRAEFFGPGLSIDEAAASCGTIGYELLTAIGGLSRPRRGLGARVDRRYLWNGSPVDPSLAGAEGM
jgi:alanine racemase